jgi:FlaG/FlaF family flagellin (archaellin)
MDKMKRKESGASEVIGAVLLVSLVVIGGAVVAAMVFGQPTPKEVPHVTFGVSLDADDQELTLHHTGGDTLRPGEYTVTWYDIYGTAHPPGSAADTSITWSSEGDMTITGVDKPVGNVVLSYLDGSGGETVLRRVPFEEYVQPVVPPVIADWSISGHKLNASGGEYTGPPVEIILYQKTSSGWVEFARKFTSGPDDFYYFEVLKKTETYRIVETVPDGWRAVNPSSGMIDDVKLNPGHIRAEDQDFTNELITAPPVLPTISGYKWNVTAADVVTGPQAGIQIILERLEKNGKYTFIASDTTDENGYYEFTVPDDGSNYQLREVVDDDIWIIRSPPGGVITGVLAGATNQDFRNEWITPPATTTISGRKWKVDATGAVLDPPGVPGITIRLDLVNPASITGFSFPMTTTTDAEGYYSFTVPATAATYRLTETGLDIKNWIIFSPADGVIDGVVPGAANQDFLNQWVAPNGIVMFLNKTVEPGCPGGHVVDGTTFMGEASKDDTLTINGKTYKFKGNEEFRFTIEGDQDSGELKVEHFDLTKLTFNVRFEVRDKGTTEWEDPRTGGWIGQAPPYPVIGVPTQVSLTSINKNRLNEDSTLAYYQEPCITSDTLLRLNGDVWCDVRNPPGNNTLLDFRDLHMVHDNRYGEGLNTMWVYLMPGYDYLLVQGSCWSP